MAPDRPDVAYAVKEAARSMSQPTKIGMRKLKRIGRYLLGAPRAVATFEWQKLPGTVTAFIDSDLAG